MFNKDRELIAKVKGLWMVNSSKTLHSYFEDNFFGHDRRGCNGVESEEDELGYVC
jgi:ribosomal 30S subunit maturation factor RimM